MTTTPNKANQAMTDEQRSALDSAIAALNKCGWTHPVQFIEQLLAAQPSQAQAAEAVAESPKETMERLTHQFNQMSELERAVIGDFIKRESTPPASPVASNEREEISGHQVHELFLKWSEYTREIGEAVSQKNIDGFVADLRAMLAASPPAESSIETNDCEECGTIGVTVGANCPRCGTRIAPAAESKTLPRESDAALAEEAHVGRRMSETLAEVYLTILGDDAPDSEGNAIDKVLKAAQVLRMEVDLYRAQAAQPVADDTGAMAVPDLGAIREALRWTAATLQSIVLFRKRQVAHEDTVTMKGEVKTVDEVLDMADAALGLLGVDAETDPSGVVKGEAE